MHISVMLFELIKYLDIKPNGVYIDCTFGYGGHSLELLKYLNKDGLLLVIEKDKCVLKDNFVFFKTYSRVKFYNCSFNEINDIVLINKLEKEVDGIFVDLGISSNHYLDFKRGFGFSNEGFFDFRLDIDQSIRAVDWINFSNFNELHCAFSFIDNKKLSADIIDNILLFRRSKKIKTIKDFYDIIIKSCSINNINNFCIGKIFNSIRMFINNEIFLLFDFLNKCIELVKPGGILVIISFNSIEDKIIKNFFYNNKKIINHSIKPSLLELNFNYSSRSAIMRIFLIQ